MSEFFKSIWTGIIDFIFFIVLGCLIPAGLWCMLLFTVQDVTFTAIIPATWSPSLQFLMKFIYWVPIGFILTIIFEAMLKDGYNGNRAFTHFDGNVTRTVVWNRIKMPYMMYAFIILAIDF